MHSKSTEFVKFYSQYQYFDVPTIIDIIRCTFCLFAFSKLIAQQRLSWKKERNQNTKITTLTP